MTTSHVENGGKPPVPVADPPAFAVQANTRGKPRGTSATLKFDPRRRESRSQLSPSDGKGLVGRIRSPRSSKSLAETTLPPLNKAGASPGASLNSQILLRSDNKSPKMVKQRQLSDHHVPKMPMTATHVHNTGSDTTTPTADAGIKSQRTLEGEVTATLSSVDAPPRFLTNQIAPSFATEADASLHTRSERAEEHVNQSRRSSQEPGRGRDLNPLVPTPSSSNNNNADTDSLKLTAVVPLVSAESAETDWNRENEWLKVPILYYFCASLIRFCELQESYLVDGQFSDMAYEQLLQLNIVGERVTYSADEISGILLNKVFAHWSDAMLRKRVQDVLTQWTTNGPRSDGFQDSSRALIDDITEDRPCIIRYTQFYVVRQYLGSKDHYGVVLTLSSVVLVICIVCIVLLAILGRKHVVACIVLSAVMGVAVILGYILILLILHHNYYADAAEKFFRAQSLTVTKDEINEDDDSINNVWMAPLGDLPHRSSGDATLNNRSLPDTRQDGVNALRMSPLNYTTNQVNLSQLQAQIVRQSISHSEGDLRSASIDSLIGRSSSQQIVNSLTESISVTALVYCNDYDLVESVSLTLWKNNFCVFCSTDMTALDAAYRRGSERFKVILVSARELTINGSRLQTALDWVVAGRPIFFFAESESEFSELIPSTTRVRVPLTAVYVRRILLAGIAISEEDAEARDDAKCAVPAYTLGRRLGGGAFGNVFEAQLEGTGARCAVKRIYLKESADDNTDQEGGPSKQLRDIAQEVEIMSSLTHPNIVQYLFCQREDNCISIFMELCSGGSLNSMIKKGEVADAGTIKRILAEILRAVAYLHNKRIVHRDLKPDNVLFSNNHAKLTDFGTAVHKRGELNIVTGTFAYMAPEILVGESYGNACDIWSVGCIAAEMLSIDLPQRGMGPPEMATLYRQIPLNSAIEIKCDTPDIVSFLQSCLQRNPTNRASATGLLGAQMLSKESNDIAQWLIEVSHRKKLKRQQSGLLTHNPSFDLNSSDMSLNSNQ